MYTPRIVPGEADDLPRFFRDELNFISRGISGARSYIVLSALHAEPKTVVEDMLVQADGTDWNPGSGRGLYQYRSGSWVFIG